MAASRVAVAALSAFGLIVGCAAVLAPAAGATEGPAGTAVVTTNATTEAVPPGAPENLTVSSAPDAMDRTAAATVAWDPPADPGSAPVTGYVITPYLVTGSDPEPVAQLALRKVVTAAQYAAGQCSAVVSGLRHVSSYTFTVAAVSSAGTGPESAQSDPVSTPKGVPGPPTAVAVAASNGTVTVHWQAPADDGGGGASSLHYVAMATPLDANWCTTDGLTCTISGLQAGVVYAVKVTAQSDVGWGLPSAPSQPVSTCIPTRLALTSAPASLRYGAVAAVTGTLARGDTGAPLSNAGVQLQYRRNGSGAGFAWAASARTDAAGVVRFPSYKPHASGQLRLVAPTSGSYGASTSTARTLAVAREVSLRSSVRSLRKGRSFTISGSVTPKSAGKTVTLQRRSGSAWVRVAANKLTSRSAYSITVKTKAKGSTSYRVTIASDSGYATGTSGSVTVKVS